MILLTPSYLSIRWLECNLEEVQEDVSEGEIVAQFADSNADDNSDDESSEEEEEALLIPDESEMKENIVDEEDGEDEESQTQGSGLGSLDFVQFDSAPTLPSLQTNAEDREIRLNLTEKGTKSKRRQENFSDNFEKKKKKLRHSPGPVDIKQKKKR